MVAPVEPGPSWGTLDQVLEFAWVVIAGVCGVLWRLYSSINGRLTDVEKKQEAVDHDLRSLRHGQAAAEKLAEVRHAENRQDRADDRQLLGEIKDSINEEFKYLRTKVDRLSERE